MSNLDLPGRMMRDFPAARNYKDGELRQPNTANDDGVLVWGAEFTGKYAVPPTENERRRLSNIWATEKTENWAVKVRNSPEMT